jgi:divinyl protochlorophyllide a 8-vinyl-reductase
MSEAPVAGLIGPNAILQMMPVLERLAGREGAMNLLWQAGVAALPDGQQMIPEGEAVRLHQWLRREMGEAAPAMSAEAGRNTARYILAHRIPAVAQRLLRVLPAPLAARALARAISHHAWTFAGSGQFSSHGPWCFEIADNPLVRGEASDTCLCHWHASVFETLYRDLVHPDCTCRETCCGAQPRQGVCRFEITCR